METSISKSTLLDKCKTEAGWVESFNLQLDAIEGCQVPQTIRVAVGYQRRPIICNSCKVFGHSDNNCPKMCNLHIPHVDKSVQIKKDKAIVPEVGKEKIKKQQIVGCSSSQNVPEKRTEITLLRREAGNEIPEPEAQSMLPHQETQGVRVGETIGNGMAHGDQYLLVDDVSTQSPGQAF